MNQYPLHFKAEAQAVSGIQSTWTMNSYSKETSCAIPPEFDGPGNGFSPEDLFAQALTNCLIGTFKVYAENSKLNFDQIKIQTELSVDTNESRKVCMKKCHLDILLVNPSNIDKAQLLIKKSFESGFILNSVKTELTYKLVIQ
jgi:organic hydroperoxide reductase OsmC/OhrA